MADGAVAANISSMANATALNFADDANFVLRSFFYLVTPNETTYEEINQVPNYFLKALVFLPLMTVVEITLLVIQGRRLPTFGDAMCSLCCGLLIFLPVALAGQLELSLYIWCYEKFHIIDLPWDSLVTWFLCVMAVDLMFYIWHRASHEINIVWAVHQVHHTSQEFNMTVGVRLPAFNRHVAMLFYLPCALFFPPSIFYAHYQLNYIFQFWIHTDGIPSIGFLDYILNTPSLHRVHHGRNRYCIDKNYGAVFSIWDVLFGTFERERPNEEIFYGLVHSVNSFDPIYIQFHHLKSIWNNLIHREGFTNKVSSIVKGPGWEPGKPRLGNVEEIPEVPEDKQLHSVSLPLWVKTYLVTHYMVAFYLFFRIKITKALFAASFTWLHGGYVLWAIINQGMFLDRRPSAFLVESVRCAAYFVLEAVLQGSLVADPYICNVMRVVFGASFVVCAINSDLFRKDINQSKKKVN